MQPASPTAALARVAAPASKRIACMSTQKIRPNRLRGTVPRQVRVSELDGILNAHAFLRVERPPELWATSVELEPFIRLLGEMIAAALVRNGHKLEEITLNVSNVVVEPEAAGPAPEGDHVAVTIRSRGDWGPRRPGCRERRRA
jgi:hypothetical protein